MGIMLNEDCSHFLSSRSNIIETVDLDYLNTFIDQYANTNVTDFLMNIFSTLSYVPSEMVQFVGEKYFLKKEMDTPVDYTNDSFIQAVHHIWFEKKLDMYQIWIDRCRFNNIHPWLSFRMNNAEFPYKNEPHVHLSNYYYEHYDDYARVQHRTKQYAYDLCRDYEIEEFRKYMLSYIAEMLNRYDVFGIELDFMREYPCFKLGHEWDGIQILTLFMGEVKKIVTKAEEKYHHKINILVRCPCEPRVALEWGFDIVTWAKLNLIDVVVPSPNWITTDNDVPLTLWKSILDAYNTEVVGCIERNINCNPDYFDTIVKREYGFFLQPNTLESFCGSAVATLSQIPEKLYLFNYMDNPETSNAPKEISRPKEEYVTILNCTSDFEKLMHMTRKHIVSYNDTPLPWMKCNSVFPLAFGGRKEARHIKINTGRIPNDMKCTLRLGMSSNQTADVFLNSVKVKLISKQFCDDPVLTDSTLYCFDIPNNIIKSQYQVIEILASETTVDYADILVSYDA